MNTRWLKVVLFLVLYLGICDASAQQRVPINAEECAEALLKYKDTLLTFYKAIEQDDAEKLVTLIENANWDRETKHRNSQRFLYIASFKGQVNSIEALISQVGVDVNISDPDNNNWTALHYTVLNGDKASRLNSFYILITLGADTDILNAQGHKPLWYMLWFHAKKQNKKRHFLSIEEKKKVVELLLDYAVMPIYIKDLLRLGHYRILHRWVSMYGEDGDRKEAVLKSLSGTKRIRHSPELIDRVIHMAFDEGKQPMEIVRELTNAGIPVAFTTVQTWIRELRNRVVSMILDEGKSPEDIVKELADAGTTVSLTTIQALVQEHNQAHGSADAVSTQEPPQEETQVNNGNYIIRDDDDEKYNEFILRVNGSDSLYSLAIEDLLEGKGIEEVLDDFPSLDRTTLEHHYRMYRLNRLNRSVSN